MLIGRYSHCLDDKLRLIVPSKLREELGENFYIVYDFDKCLSLYPQESYFKLSQKISALSDFNKASRALKRIFFSNSMDLTCDKQGRVVLPKILVDKISMLKDIMIIGMNDHLEIWDKGVFNEFETTSEDAYSDLAALFGGETHE